MVGESSSLSRNHQFRFWMCICEFLQFFRVCIPLNYPTYSKHVYSATIMVTDGTVIHKWVFVEISVLAVWYNRPIYVNVISQFG